MNIRKTDIKVNVAIRLGISTMGENSVTNLKGQNHSHQIEAINATPINTRNDKNAK